MLSDNQREAIVAQVVRLLREEREKRGLSLGTVSRKSGLSRQTIGYIEQARRNPTLDTMLRICGVLGVHLDHLIRRARNVAEANQPAKK